MGTRASVEGIAVVLRSIVTYVLLVQFQLGAPAFGIAQLIYSLTLVFGYYGFFFWKILKTKDLPFHSIRQLFPSKQPNMY